MIRQPSLPALAQSSIFAFEGGILLWGAYVMRSRDTSAGKRWASVGFTAFLCIILAGCTANLVLTDKRPDFSSQQNTAGLQQPLHDQRWASFDVAYPDHYYADVEMEAKRPFTFAIVSDTGETVYSVSGSDVHRENVQLKLKRGTYWLSVSADDGYDVHFEID